MTMIEKIARAIYNNEHGERTIEECRSHSIAALEAMKEPTTFMLQQGNNVRGTGSSVYSFWNAMIEAALKE